MGTGSLSGRLALVTGAGMGIGQGIAIELARQGADVAIHYASSAAGAIETVAEIQKSGAKAIAIQGNLREVGECLRVVNAAASFLGGLDILVNNSGVTRTVDFLAMTQETYDEVFDLNIRGYFFCAQTAV